MRLLRICLIKILNDRQHNQDAYNRRQSVFFQDAALNKSEPVETCINCH